MKHVHCSRNLKKQQKARRDQNRIKNNKIKEKSLEKITKNSYIATRPIFSAGGCYTFSNFKIKNFNVKDIAEILFRDKEKFSGFSKALWNIGKTLTLTGIVAVILSSGLACTTLEDYDDAFSDLKDSEGNSVCDSLDPCWFYVQDVPPSYAKKAAKELLKKNIKLNPIKIAKLYKLNTDPSSRLFVKAYNMFSSLELFYFVDDKIDLEKAINLYEKLNHIKKNDGKLRYDALAISTICRSGAENNFILEIAEFEYKGQRVFSDLEVQRICQGKKNIKETKKFIKKLLDKGYDNFRISRYAQLGLSLDEVLKFQDTEKPNAFVVYPMDDTFGAFENEDSVKFFKDIHDTYDTYVIFAEKEDQIYKAISYVPKIELLILGGHGDGEENRLQLGKGESEENFIDTLDKEIEKYIAKLKPGSVIFLYSCETAKGGKKNPNNLFNFIVKYAKKFGINVIAPSTGFPSEGIEINDTYPLDLELYNQDGENVTVKCSE